MFPFLQIESPENMIPERSGHPITCIFSPIMVLIMMLLDMMKESVDLFGCVNMMNSIMRNIIHDIPSKKTGPKDPIICRIGPVGQLIDGEVPKQDDEASEQRGQYKTEPK